MAAIDTYWPGILGSIGGSSISTLTFAANTTVSEWVFEAMASDTITALGFYYSAKGAGTPPQYTISLCSVDSNGNPSTVLQSGTFTPPNSSAWNATWQWVNLSVSQAITKGNLYGITLGTAGTANSDIFGISMSVSNGTGFGFNFPYQTTNLNSVRTRNQGAAPYIGYQSATKSYGAPGVLIVTNSINTGTSPDEVGMEFTLPAGMASSYALSGAVCVLNTTVTVSGTIRMQLEDSSGTVLQTITIPKYLIDSTTRRPVRFRFSDASLATLTVGTKYRLWFQSSDANNVGYNKFTSNSAQDAMALAGVDELAFCSRHGGGSVTPDANSRLACDLLLSDITATASGMVGSRIFSGF